MKWGEIFRSESKKEYFRDMYSAILADRQRGPVYPKEEDLFSAFKHCTYENTKVVILGQDPYHGPGQAHGLSFSVPKGVDIPPSLRNIHKELQSDLGITPPNHGSLLGWARQGVLLLNTFLTVRDGEPGSHRKIGWEIFTDQIIMTLDRKETPVVFLLWGAPAKSKRNLLMNQWAIESAHPSPLSAYKGFFGSKPFSHANAILQNHHETPIDWSQFE